MTEKRNLKLSTIPEGEKKVLKFLQKKGSVLYGNIFKDLKIPPTKGSEIILSLTYKGYIKNVGRSSYYELNVELEH